MLRGDDEVERSLGGQLELLVAADGVGFAQHYGRLRMSIHPSNAPPAQIATGMLLLQKESQPARDFVCISALQVRLARAQKRQQSQRSRACIAFLTLTVALTVAILGRMERVQAPTAVSMLMFGTNSMFVARETESNVIAAYDVLWRYGAAFLFAALGLVTVAALSFMLSAFAENSIGPIVATVSVLIILTILTELQIPFYDETIKPYLFTTHMLGWKGFFYVKGVDGVTVDGSINNLGSVLRSAAILVAYSAAFLGTAIWYFRKKNILS